MTHDFDTFQVNMLLTGRDLYALLPDTPEGRLVILTVWGYEQAPRPSLGAPPVAVPQRRPQWGPLRSARRGGRTRLGACWLWRCRA
jgi:hypothetical protein